MAGAIEQGIICHLVRAVFIGGEYVDLAGTETGAVMARGSWWSM